VEAGAEVEEAVAVAEAEAEAEEGAEKKLPKATLPPWKRPR